MKVKVDTRDDGATTLSPQEDIVTENVEEFKRLIEDVVARDGGKPLYLELRELNYLCSAAVGVIACAHRNLRDKDAELVLLNPTEKVSRLLMVTRLDTVLRIVRDEDSAEDPSAS